MLAKMVFASRLSWLLYPIYRQTLAKPVRRLFFSDLIRETNYFHAVSWQGTRVFQNVLDLWTTAETISEIKPELLIESGTYEGGSALFYASLFNLMNRGHVITIDIEKQHEHTHPRVEFLIGDSLSHDVVERCREQAQATAGAVMVILDSEHARDHVQREMETYAPLVTPGSYLLVQDGVIDRLDMLRNQRPGPLPAIHDFLRHHPDFEVDRWRCERFLVTHHPDGWLRRRTA